VTSKGDQYARGAAGWSEREYADTRLYLAHRAELVRDLGPRLRAGDEVLDLACGDGGLGEALLARGMRYRGVDATPEMVEQARSRLGARARVELGDLNDFEPGGQVAATTVFRAVYYAADRRSFFARVAAFTTGKLVFDLNPRQYDVADVLADLAAVGLTRFALRPFFVPQRVRLVRPVAWGARLAEQSGPLARLVLRYRFTYLVAAWRISVSSPGNSGPFA
jgi:Methyltransferase domain